MEDHAPHLFSHFAVVGLAPPEEAPLRRHQRTGGSGALLPSPPPAAQVLFRFPPPEAVPSTEPMPNLPKNFAEFCFSEGVDVVHSSTKPPASSSSAAVPFIFRLPLGSSLPSSSSSPPPSSSASSSSSPDSGTLVKEFPFLYVTCLVRFEPLSELPSFIPPSPASSCSCSPCSCSSSCCSSSSSSAALQHAANGTIDDTAAKRKERDEIKQKEKEKEIEGEVDEEPQQQPAEEIIDDEQQTQNANEEEETKKEENEGRHFECPICGQAFPLERILAVHLEDWHSNSSSSSSSSSADVATAPASSSSYIPSSITKRLPQLNTDSFAYQWNKLKQQLKADTTTALLSSSSPVRSRPSPLSSSPPQPKQQQHQRTALSNSLPASFLSSSNVEVNAYAKRCYCLLSIFPFFDMHFEVLHELLEREDYARRERESRSSNRQARLAHLPNEGERSQQQKQEKDKEGTTSPSMTRSTVLELLSGYHAARVPLPGRSVSFVTPAPFFRLISFSCPDKDVEGTMLGEWCISPLFKAFSLDNILRIFAALLMEKQIIVVCKDLTLLSAVVHSTIPMIRPLEWQGLHIPILPRSMLGYLEAPVPYIMGTQSLADTQLNPKIASDVVYVFPMNNKVICHNLPRLPELSKLYSNLSPLHSSIQASSPHPKPSFFSNTLSSSRQTTSIAQQTLKAFQEYLCWLTGKILDHRAGFDLSKTSEKEIQQSFLESINSQNREFVSSFLRTQLWDAAKYSSPRISSSPEVSQE